MTLKQVKHEDRIIFLRKFTEEIFLTICRGLQAQKNIRIEKLKQKFIRPSMHPDEAFKKIIGGPIKNTVFRPSRYSTIKPILPQKSTMSFQPSFPGQRRPTLHRAEMQQVFKQQERPAIQKPRIIPIETDQQKMVMPVPSKRPEDLSLGKLDVLLNDSSVQTIECPGPGKNMLIKRHNKINVTRITLSQEEITKAIDDLSKKARIPIIGGLFKAAIGDLIISAVISEFIGSRFIINKMSPYSIIEN